MSEDRPQCRYCEFWIPIYRDAFGRGECHGAPPSVAGKGGSLLTVFETHWPQTKPDDWCGQFQAARRSE